MEKYVVEIEAAGIFKEENTAFDNKTFFDLIEADSIDEVKKKVYSGYGNCLDVIYYPINIWKLGERVMKREEVALTNELEAIREYPKNQKESVNKFLIEQYKNEIENLRKKRDDEYSELRNNKDKAILEVFLPLYAEDNLSDAEKYNKASDAYNETLENEAQGLDSYSQRINALACKIDELEKYLEK